VKIRRVVTAHDGNGKATVAIDEISRDVVSFRPGATIANIWSSEGFPVDNTGGCGQGQGNHRHDARQRHRLPGHRIWPGRHPAQSHRTNSIDYAVVLSGEIDMELDDRLVTLRAGDVLVQRGNHFTTGSNRSNAPCVIAFVLIARTPRRTRRQDLGGARLGQGISIILEKTFSPRAMPAYSRLSPACGETGGNISRTCVKKGFKISGLIALLPSGTK